MWTAEKEQLDFWKGVSLIGLTCNHLLLWPLKSISQGLALTYQSLGWFTFASVYFATAGILWGRRAYQSDSLIRWNVVRAAQLLLWTCIVTLFFKLGMAADVLKPAPWQSHLDWSHNTLVASAAIGRQIPWLVDVIWLHACFGIFSTALWSLPGTSKSPWVILGTSMLLWLVDQTFHTSMPGHSRWAPPWHSWMSWQLLFVVSALSQSDRFSVAIRFISSRNVRKHLFFIAIAFLVAKHSFTRESVSRLADTQTFAPLFAINSLILLSLINSNEKKIFSRRIVNLGRYSLSGYTVHCGLIYALGGNLSLLQKAPLFALVVLSLCLLSLLMFSHVRSTWRGK